MAFARAFRLGSIFKCLPARSRRDGRWLVVGLLGVLLTIAVPLAYSSLPDLSWIPGMYDDRDYDDVVVMLIDDVGLSNSGSKFQHVAWFLIGSVVCLPKRRGSWPALSRHTIRGPPNEPPGSMPHIPLASRLQAKKILDGSRAGGIARPSSSSSIRPPAPPLVSCSVVLKRSRHARYRVLAGVRRSSRVAGASRSSDWVFRARATRCPCVSGSTELRDSLCQDRSRTPQSFPSGVYEAISGRVP